MKFYDFNIDTYNEVLKIVKFRFYEKIKNTGIVFKELLEAKNLVTNDKFYILVCDDQEIIHYVRFKETLSLLHQLNSITKKRLERLICLEDKLLSINNIEDYGEGKYFNSTEMTAMGISSIKEFLIFLNKKITLLRKVK